MTVEFEHTFTAPKYPTVDRFLPVKLNTTGPIILSASVEGKMLMTLITQEVRTNVLTKIKIT